MPETLSLYHESSAGFCNLMFYCFSPVQINTKPSEISIISKVKMAHLIILIFNIGPPILLNRILRIVFHGLFEMNQ